MTKCSEDRDDEDSGGGGDQRVEDENKTKRQKYKGKTANLCCNPKDA